MIIFKASMERSFRINHQAPKQYFNFQLHNPFFSVESSSSPSSRAFLLCLYNCLWVESSFPQVWSTSYVIPIPKPGKDPCSAENQLPISLTCHTRKLMEKRVAMRLFLTLMSLHTFSNLQFGFLRLDHDIRKAFFNSNMVLAIFFYLEKAYDTTWRNGVLIKLHSLGLLGLLSSFSVRS